MRRSLRRKSRSNSETWSGISGGWWTTSGQKTTQHSWKWMKTRPSLIRRMVRTTSFSRNLTSWSSKWIRPIKPNRCSIACLETSRLIRHCRSISRHRLSKSSMKMSITMMNTTMRKRNRRTKTEMRSSLYISHHLSLIKGENKLMIVHSSQINNSQCQRQMWISRWNRFISRR